MTRNFHNLVTYIAQRECGIRGFSPQHLWHVRQFFQAFRHSPRLSLLLRELPRYCNLHILNWPQRQFTRNSCRFPHYYGQNLLAQSLHEKAYDHDPGFRRFREATGLLFKAHASFKKADLDDRQKLYQKLAERIWSPENILREAEA